MGNSRFFRSERHRQTPELTEKDRIKVPLNWYLYDCNELPVRNVAYVDEAKLHILFWINSSYSCFYIFKIMFKLFIRTKGNKTKILALVSLDLDKRAKSSEGLKIRD